MGFFLATNVQPLVIRYANYTIIWKNENKITAKHSRRVLITSVI